MWKGVCLATGGEILAEEKTIFPLCLSGNLYNLVGSSNCVTISWTAAREGEEEGGSNASVEREKREKGKNGEREIKGGEERAIKPNTRIRFGPRQGWEGIESDEKIRFRTLLCRPP